MLDKILIREFDVPQNSAGRIATYFINSATEVNLLNPDSTFQKFDGSIKHDEETISEKPNDDATGSFSQGRQNAQKQFSISIDGPGIKFNKDIMNLNDFVIINAILESIKNNFTDKGSE